MRMRMSGLEPFNSTPKEWGSKNESLFLRYELVNGDVNDGYKLKKYMSLKSYLNDIFQYYQISETIYFIFFCIIFPWIAHVLHTS